MTVNIQHLRAFYAIASDGSISRAARRLNVAQPTLSQQLKALEERHHAALFEGRKPPLQLTALGRELFALTQRLFSSAAMIDDLLGSDPSQGIMSVRLGSDSPIYAARMVAKLRELQPDLAIQVRVGNARETLKYLDEALVDVALVVDPPVNGQYAYAPLFADWFMVAVPSGHPRASDRAFPVAALGESRMLVRETNSRTRMMTEQLLSHAQIEPSDFIELHTRETIREGVALGLGVSLFISSECPPDRRIAYVPLERSPEVILQNMTSYVVCLAGRKRTPLVRMVIAIAEQLTSLSPIPLPAMPLPATLLAGPAAGAAPPRAAKSDGKSRRKAAMTDSALAPAALQIS